MTTWPPGGDRPLDAQHPLLAWARRELAPVLVERLAPTLVVVFDPPDRSADLGRRALGLLVVASAFRGVPVPERVQRVRWLTRAAAAVRALCLTPEEWAVAESAPGPALAAARLGVRLL